jgi:hypothetical protein
MAPPKKTPTKVPAIKAPDEDYEDELEETPSSSQATPSLKKSRTPKREWVYNHIPNASYSGNGRQEGRVLIPWTRKLFIPLPPAPAQYEPGEAAAILILHQRIYTVPCPDHAFRPIPYCPFIK